MFAEGRVSASGRRDCRCADRRRMHGRQGMKIEAALVERKRDGRRWIQGPDPERVAEPVPGSWTAPATWKCRRPGGRRAAPPERPEPIARLWHACGCGRGYASSVAAVSRRAHAALSHGMGSGSQVNYVGKTGRRVLQATQTFSPIYAYPLRHGYAHGRLARPPERECLAGASSIPAAGR